MVWVLALVLALALALALALVLFLVGSFHTHVYNPCCCTAHCQITGILRVSIEHAIGRCGQTFKQQRKWDVQKSRLWLKSLDSTLR